jgi:DNA-binding response OmpR family regulator
LRPLSALQRDPRVALFYADELSPKWVSFAQRVAGTIVVAAKDPLGELAYAATAGIRSPIILAMPKRYKPDARNLIEAGAAACIALPITPRDIGRVLPMLARAAAPVHVDARLKLLLDPITRVVRYGDKTVRLSQREFAVLHCLSAKQGQPVSAGELLKTVWADGGAAATRLILDVYISHLRKKLQRLGLRESLTTVRGFGYALSNS